MKKFTKTMTALGLFSLGSVGVMLTATPEAVAQATKGKEKSPETKLADKVKDEPKKTTAVKGKVLIKEDKKDLFRFSVVDQDDKTVMQSTKGYKTVKEAREALEEAKAILGSANVTIVPSESEPPKPLKPPETIPSKSKGS